jgi:hypothetical protein
MKKTSKKLIDFERLVNLFFTFVIGTISLLMHQFIQFPAFSLREGLRMGLLIIGVFSYEAVIVALISYYAAKAKSKVAEFFENNPKRFYMLIVTILGATYVLLNTLIEKSVLIFFRDLVMVSLMVVALPMINNYFEKRKNGKKNKVK